MHIGKPGSHCNHNRMGTPMGQDCHCKIPGTYRQSRRPKPKNSCYRMNV